MGKIFFFDFDGTLLPTGPNKEIDPKTIYALEALIKNGNDVVIATGRPESMIRCKIDVIERANHITLNGSQIIFDNKLTYVEAFPREAISNIFNIAEENNLMIGCPMLNKYYILNKNYNNRIVSKFFTDISSEMPEIFCEIRKEDIISQLWLIGDFDEVNLSDYSIPGLSFFKCHENAYDIVIGNMSKAVGMKKYMEIAYPNSEKETIAFGDSHNDIEMLKFADIGIAMGNAVPELKKIAVEVTESCEEFGVYNYLVKNNYIEPLYE